MVSDTESIGSAVCSDHATKVCHAHLSPVFAGDHALGIRLLAPLGWLRNFDSHPTPHVAIARLSNVGDQIGSLNHEAILGLIR